MDKKSQFNPYDGPKPILSIFQGSYGGYHGPCLVIYENGLIIRGFCENIEDDFSDPEFKVTVISPEELNLLKNEISIQIDKITTSSKTKYEPLHGMRCTCQPCIDIMCNISSVKHIRIEYCYIKNKKISYLFRDNKFWFGVNSKNIFLKLYYLLKGEIKEFDKADEIPESIQNCLKFLCEYKFSDLKEYVSFYFKFKLQGKKSEGETVDWPEDLPSLDTFHVEEYSGDFTFYIEGIYYKRVLEFYLSNQHKNIRFRNADREMFYYPQLIFPYEDLFNYYDWYR